MNVKSTVMWLRKQPQGGTLFVDLLFDLICPYVIIAPVCLSKKKS